MLTTSTDNQLVSPSTDSAPATISSGNAGMGKPICSTSTTANTISTPYCCSSSIKFAIQISYLKNRMWAARACGAVLKRHAAGNGRQQRARVGMGRVAVNVVGIAHFHHLSLVHHHHLVGDVSHHRQVVRDED